MAPIGQFALFALLGTFANLHVSAGPIEAITRLLVPDALPREKLAEMVRIAHLAHVSVRINAENNCDVLRTTRTSLDEERKKQLEKCEKINQIRSFDDSFKSEEMLEKDAFGEMFKQIAYFLTHGKEREWYILDSPGLLSFMGLNSLLKQEIALAQSQSKFSGVADAPKFFERVAQHILDTLNWKMAEFEAVLKQVKSKSKDKSANFKPLRAVYRELHVGAFYLMLYEGFMRTTYRLPATKNAQVDDDFMDLWLARCSTALNSYYLDVKYEFLKMLDLSLKEQFPWEHQILSQGMNYWDDQLGFGKRIPGVREFLGGLVERGEAEDHRSQFRGNYPVDCMAISR